MKFTYGADFEMFLRRKGEVIPVCGLLGGTKTEPLQFPDARKGFMYQEDGVTAEFNVPPSETPAILMRDIQEAVRLGQSTIHSKIGKNVSLYAVSATAFDLSELKKHEQAMRVGCDPDFQAYFEGRARPTPDIETFGGWRYAGFHIHVGYDKALLPEWMMALTLDHYLYGEFDASCRIRARSYPRGIFRPKPYGVEYRGLGSSWLNNLTHVQDRLVGWERSMQADFGRTVEHCLEHMDRRQRELQWWLPDEPVNQIEFDPPEDAFENGAAEEDAA